MPWRETTRLLCVYPHPVWRWRSGGARPNGEHLTALLNLADSMGPGHLFTDQVRGAPEDPETEELRHL